MNNKRTITALVFFFLAAAGIFLFAKPKVEEMRSEDALASEVKPAPEFTLKDINGADVKLSDFAGKTIVLNFWATWCGPCRREIPDFVALQEQYGKDGLQFIGVALDEQGVTVVKPFSEKLKVNYPSLIGSYDLFAKYGGSNAIPVTFLIDKKGNIRGNYVGMRPKESLEQMALALMREK
jgi:thiol-disulfide isomerase/thioredoxin